MFSPTQKIREYRAEQKRHAQIAREIDDALTDHSFFKKHYLNQFPVGNLAFQRVAGTEIQPAAVFTQEQLDRIVNMHYQGCEALQRATTLRPLKLGERAGY